MIRILLVVDVLFYREGLEELLARSGAVEVLGAVSCANDADDLARRTQPDVVLLDIGSPDAREALARVQCIEPKPRVVALAVAETPQGVLEWIEAGVAGYVPRNASLGDLLRVLEGVVRDETYCPPHITATMIRRLAALAATTRATGVDLDALTAREQEILSLVAQGLSNKAIAVRLGIASATAKNHVHNILDKLNLRRRVEAASVLHRQADRLHGLR
jgi:DNA-binding NarL/FixJ family response regulator